MSQGDDYFLPSPITKRMSTSLGVWLAKCGNEIRIEILVGFPIILLKSRFSPKSCDSIFALPLFCWSGWWMWWLQLWQPSWDSTAFSPQGNILRIRDGLWSTRRFTIIFWKIVKNKSIMNMMWMKLLRVPQLSSCITIHRTLMRWKPPVQMLEQEVRRRLHPFSLGVIL